MTSKLKNHVVIIIYHNLCQLFSSKQIYGGGHFKSNNKLYVTVRHLFRINSGGRLSHNHAGYVTKEGRTGDEFEPSEGPGQGTGSILGASGAGYAGTGGRGTRANRVGQFYGSYKAPYDYGSAGGYGQHYGKQNVLSFAAIYKSSNQSIPQQRLFGVLGKLLVLPKLLS